MRYRKTGLADDFISVKEDIDIERARTFIRVACAKILLFDFKAGAQQLVGGQGCCWLQETVLRNQG